MNESDERQAVVHGGDRAPRCARCGYDLRGSSLDAQCPECGLSVRDSAHAESRNVTVLLRPLRSQPEVLTLYCLCAFEWACLLVDQCQEHGVLRLHWLSWVFALVFIVLPVLEAAVLFETIYLAIRAPLSIRGTRIMRHRVLACLLGFVTIAVILPRGKWF